MMDILKRLDLNLLVAFDILLDERSVTRAAARLSLSQPATSAALARLRACFNDQLLIRSRGEMFLTERANALRQPIKDALRAVALALEAQDIFKPETFDGRFRLAMTDIASFTLGSDIVQHLRQHAPLASAEFIALDRSRLYDWFRNDMIDAAVVVYDADEGMYEAEHLFDDQLIFIASNTHPLRRKRAQSVARLTSYPLIDVSIATAIMRPFFEQQEALGHKWSIRVSVPYYLAVPSLLEASDCIGIMGRLAARKFQATGNVSVLEISEPTPTYRYKLLWHKRRAHDPAHLWMRKMIGAIAARQRP